MFFPGLRKDLRIVLAALDVGEHVYCEWPLGRNLQEAEELAARPRLGKLIRLRRMYDMQQAVFLIARLL
jgi:hypothetical protein